MLSEHDFVIRKFMRLVDILVILASFFISYYVRQNFHIFYKLDLLPSIHVVSDEIASFEKYISFLILIVPVWTMTLNFLGTYKSFRIRSPLEIAWMVAKSTFYTTLVFGALAFLFKIQYVSRLLFAIFMFLTTILIMSEKFIIIFAIRYIRKKGYNYRRMLIVGSGERAQNFINVIEKHPEWGFRISGIVDDDSKKVGHKVSKYDVIGVLSELQEILHKMAIDEVVFVAPRSWLNKIQDSIAVCELEGIRATLEADLFDLKIAHARQTELEGIPLITFETTPGAEWQLFIKRSIDIIVSLLGIIVLLPVFLVAAILIKLSSKGPVLFVQRRIGRNGRKFILYKFRSMYYGAHKRLAELEVQNDMSGPVFKMKNDPRITPIGRLLRRYSIDELPQLFNVLMGHMSLVGPRPPVQKEVQKYEPWQRRRLSMRPGITCTWQASGRNNIGFDKWMEMDLKYIDNWSLWLDFEILMKTIPAVMLGYGAR